MAKKQAKKTAKNKVPASKPKVLAKKVVVLPKPADKKPAKAIIKKDVEVKAKVVVTKPATEKVVKPKPAPVVKAAPMAPKPLTRPDGHVFTVTKEDVGADGKRRFLKGLPNDIIVQEGFTLQRSATAMFLVDMIMPNGTKQAMPRPMGKVEVADRLNRELIEMENARGEAKPVTAEIKKEGAVEKTTMQGVIAGEADVDHLIKNMPNGPKDAVKTNAIKNPVMPALQPDANNNLKNQPIVIPSQHIGNIDVEKADIDHKIALPAYAKSLEENLYNSFTMRMHGTMQKNELKRVLEGCLKDYTYELIDAAQGKYITVTHAEISARVPEDENKFITVI